MSESHRTLTFSCLQEIKIVTVNWERIMVETGFNFFPTRSFCLLRSSLLLEKILVRMYTVHSRTRQSYLWSWLFFTPVIFFHFSGGWGC